MNLLIYPDFLTQKKYDIKYYESPSHFVGNKYVLHALSIPVEDGIRSRTFTNEFRLSLNDKLSLILYTIYFLSYDKFFAGRNEPIFLKSFNGKDPAYYLNETQCKNLLLSIEAASAVVESKERINREVEMLKDLFKSKTSYELVIPDHVMTNILELYKSNEVDAFYAELFEFISKNYDDFMEGLSDFLFDPNIGFRVSNFKFLTSKCIYNDMNYKIKEYLSFESALEIYMSYFMFKNDRNITRKNVTKSLSSMTGSFLGQNEGLAAKTLLKFLDRGVKLNSKMTAFDCWKQILKSNKKGGK